MSPDPAPFAEYRFGDLLACKLRNGLTRPRAQRGEGVPMINMKEIFGHRRIGNLEMERVHLNARNPDADVLAPGDLLFARQSLVAEGAGKCVLFTGANEPVTFESHIIRARLNTELADPRFIFYFFESSVGRRRIASIVNQVAAAGIRGSDLMELTVPLPDMRSQMRIADLVARFDDKIERNERTGRIATDVAATALRGALLANEASTERVADLIDAGALLIGDGYRAKNSELSDEGIPFARAGNLNNGFDFSTADRVPGSLVEAIPTKCAAPGDVVFTSKGTVGRFAFVDRYIGRFVYSPQLCYWRSLDHDRLPPAVLFAWMRGPEARRQLNALKGQTDMADYVSLRDQRSMVISLPRRRVVGDLAAMLSPLTDMEGALRAESRTLKVARDALLPRLVSGRVRIPHTEEEAHGTGGIALEGSPA